MQLNNLRRIILQRELSVGDTDIQQKGRGQSMPMWAKSCLPHAAEMDVCLRLAKNPAHCRRQRICQPHFSRGLCRAVHIVSISGSTLPFFGPLFHDYSPYKMDIVISFANAIIGMTLLIKEEKRFQIHIFNMFGKREVLDLTLSSPQQTVNMSFSNSKTLHIYIDITFHNEPKRCAQKGSRSGISSHLSEVTSEQLLWNLVGLTWKYNNQINSD